MCNESLFNLVADWESWIERAERILEDDLHLAAQLALLLCTAIGETYTIKPDFASGRLLQAERNASKRRLPGSRLTNDRERLATSNREIYTINRLHRLPLLDQRDGAADREVLLQAAKFEQVGRRTGCAALLAHFAPPAISSARKQRTERSSPRASRFGIV